ncbi:MAG: NAD(P)H-hydrate epimerase [Acidimicrobiia bacterium]|nr:NAD(P)H-hydrate epimerase [Acidimicrobiia bacterium]
MTTASFDTADGIRVPAITAEEMRRVDEAAISGSGPNLYQMMENAGRSLALTVIDVLGAGWRSTPIVVLAGTGGNGGGGICAARHLANRRADVSVVVTDVARLGAVPAQQLAIYRASGGRVAVAADLDTVGPGLVVDALIGYSLTGAPRGAALALIEWIESQTAPVVSLDVPSGLDATSGVAPGRSVRADITLTLALPKTGLGVPGVGDLWVADLGIPAGVYESAGIEVPGGIFGAGYSVRVKAVADGSGHPGA